MVIGTAHILKKSSECVSEAIENVQPDTVVIEIDEKRARDMEELRKNPEIPPRFLHWGHYGGWHLRFVPVGFLGQYYSLLRFKLDVQPGNEFSAAKETAEKVGAEVIYGDLSIEEIVNPAGKKNSKGPLWQENLHDGIRWVLSTSGMFIVGVLSFEFLLAYPIIRNLIPGALIRPIINLLMVAMINMKPLHYMTTILPSSLGPQRDQRIVSYALESIKRKSDISSQKIIIVVGAGHTMGIIQQLVNEGAKVTSTTLTPVKIIAGFSFIALLCAYVIWSIIRVFSPKLRYVPNMEYRLPEGSEVICTCGSKMELRQPGDRKKSVAMYVCNECRAECDDTNLTFRCSRFSFRHPFGMDLCFNCGLVKLKPSEKNQKFIVTVEKIQEETAW